MNLRPLLCVESKLNKFHDNFSGSVDVRLELPGWSLELDRTFNYTTAVESKKAEISTVAGAAMGALSGLLLLTLALYRRRHRENAKNERALLARTKSFPRLCCHCLLLCTELFSS